MERVELHPIFNRYTVYNDHYDGELDTLGDALGRDCMIEAFLPDRLDFSRQYIGDGSRNEDWFSWNAEVFAPISGKVTEIYINEVVNVPGKMNPSRSSSLFIQSEDGITVMLGHIQNPVVAVGDVVTEGQLLAYVGNNGFSRQPHIHVGAYRGDQPLMVGFDAEKVGKLREKTDECYWIMGISDAEYAKMKGC